MNNILGTNSNEQLFGTSLADLIHGLFGDDTIYSRQADDTLKGNEGNDQLFGDSGNDRLVGGAGNDIFFYNTNAAFNQNAVGTDIIDDFGNGSDKIHLDKTTFKALASNAGFGFSKANEFAVVSQDSLVERSVSKIVFSSGTGNLFYNENGSQVGLGSGSHFATLTDVDSLAGWHFKIHN